ncbi:efflux RND transporter permease subunit [bacterium]|nr:efflux RND transporter permease subunit [bacterium]
MWLTKFAINRRVTISMFILALVIMGLVSLSRMPWDLDPKVDFPIVSVTVPYPGANPEEIEQRIVRPLEDQVSVINGVDRVVSQCQENLGSTTIRFRYGTDTDVAAADVRDALDRAKAEFPDDVEPPSIYKLDIGSMPVVTIGITGSRPPRDLRKLVEDSIKPVLGQVPGVASVAVSGGEVREIQILADRERLDAAQLSISELAQQIVAQNLDVPAGNIKEGVRDYSVRALGQFKSMDEIRNLRLNTARGSVPLSDLATVLDTVEEPSSLARTNGKAAVAISVLKQSDANTVSVVDGVKKKLEFLLGTEQKSGTMSRDLKAVIAYDASKRVREAIYDVRDSLMWGALLAAIVVFLFLHNFRGTIIVALAIPTCLIATFLPIGMGFGFTLNMIVMLGLALSVGILVDDSIVVLENIDRHLQMGEQPAIAAYNGRTEIGAAAVALTAVDVVVYIPVAMMGGIVGRFFFPFGITVFTCTIFSLLIAFTLTPMLASWWYQRTDRRVGHRLGLLTRFFGLFDAAYLRLEHAYVWLLKRAVAHPYITVGVGFAALALILMGVGPRLGFEFFPRSDEGRVAISIETAVGTRIEETDRITRQIETLLEDKQKYPEVTDIQATVGSGAGSMLGVGDVGSRFASVDITMTGRKERVRQKQRSDEGLATDLRTALARIPSATIKVTAGASDGGPSGNAIELNILGDDVEARDRAAARLQRDLAQEKGFHYVELSSKAGRPEVHATIDRLRAADQGLTVQQVAGAVRTAFAGDTSSKYRESGDEYDIRVEFRELDRSNVTDVGNLFVGRSATGQPVRLRDVADIQMSSGPSRIERYNRQRKVTLSASLASDLPGGQAQKIVQGLADKIQVPGVTFDWTGEIQMMQESFGYMGQAMLLAVILIYLVTAALYNSILEPLNIMLTLPMALVGAFLGLYLCHMNISVVAIIGLIMLMGIVGKNAILVVDYTNTMRKRGMSRTEALLTAGPHRMQPVLMTTMACVTAMVPTAVAMNEGSEWRSPMAVVVIFGLLVATVLSLIIVPASYCIWDSIGTFFSTGASRLISKWSGAEQAFDKHGRPKGGDS